MRQLTLAMTVILTLSAAALSATDRRDEVYGTFQKMRSEFLVQGSVTKKDFPSRFKTLDTELNSKYKEFKTLEKQDLTSKGNQMAYDLEMMEPLRNLAHSKLSKQDCSEAMHINDLNFNEDDKFEIEKMDLILKAVCQN